MVKVNHSINKIVPKIFNYMEAPIMINITIKNLIILPTMDLKEMIILILEKVMIKFTEDLAKIY